uniref:Lipopolysaccharide-induced tumor necrosis factor-alpha factor homolog n=1 Tax=Schistocephalus solidus TaxID=70667 RepID=A0A0X3PW03_SCHSO
MAANPPVDKTTPPPYPPPPYSGEPYQSQQPPYTPYPPYPGAPYPVDGSQQAPVVAPPTLPSYTGPAFVVATPTPLGPQSTQVLCPTCRIMVFTEVSYESGFLAWICCFFIFILGGVWGCCLIPFCIESCQDVYHRCPSCHGLLGVYSRH